VVTGATFVGNQIATSAGSWSNAPTSFSYQWWQCASTCTAIAGATQSTFTLTSGQAGDTVESEVTASNAGGSASAFSAPSAAVLVPTPAVAYQLNQAHTGFSPDPLASKPQVQWSLPLPGPVSYPLIVGGSIYVTVANVSTSGSSLYSLNAATGATQWGPVALGGTYHFSGIAYDAGSIFAVNDNGLMTQYSAATGAPGWSTQLSGQYMFTSVPTAANGYVYTGGAGSGGTVYAVNESNGTVAWTGSVMNGDHSSPAVTSGGVYVSYACGQTYDFAPTTGAMLWHRSTGCEGGGGKTPVVADSDVFVRDATGGSAILSAASGAVLGPFAASGPAPAVSANDSFDLTGGTLTASAMSNMGASWTFAGDGTLSSAPLLAGGTVVVAGTSGTVYGLNAATGAQLWTVSAGSPVAAPDEQNVAQLTGMATAGGLLVVAASDTLVAIK
jgi:outer membrane protein assembly factor BamB